MRYDELVNQKLTIMTHNSNSVLPFVTHILQGTTLTKNYTDLGSYGSPIASAYPWATAVPKLV